MVYPTVLEEYPVKPHQIAWVCREIGYVPEFQWIIPMKILWNHHKRMADVKIILGHIALFRGLKPLFTIHWGIFLLGSSQ